MSLYLVIRFLHIASAIALIGGIFARQAVRSLAKQTSDIHRFTALSEGAGRIEGMMIIPGSMAVTLFGVILALMTGAPILGFLQGASKNWLLISNILLIGNLLIIRLVFLPRGRKFEQALNIALAEGRMTSVLRGELDDRVVKLAHLYEQVSVALIVALMVFKPF